MKNNFIYFLSVLLLISCGKKEVKYSDMAEYGIKGQPKEIKTFVYNKIDLVDGEWVPENDSGYFLMSQLTINDSGFIASNFITIQNDPGDWKGTFIEYEFEKGKKSAARVYNNLNTLSETIKINWIDNYHYEMLHFIDTKLVSKNEIWLNYNFNQNKELQEYHDFNTGKEHLKFEFISAFSYDGEVIGGMEIDYKKNKITRLNFESKNRDVYGNPLMKLIYEDNSDKPKKIEKRIIIYHDH